MKYHYLLVVAFLLPLFQLSAQRITPLEGYEQLARIDKNRPADQPKMSCAFTDLNVEVLLAGDSANIFIEVDTVGFGAGSQYTCLNCDVLTGGTLTATSSGFLYRANLGITQALDTLQLAFCNAAGDTCSVSEQVIVLVQRASREVTLPLQTLGPQERTEVVVPEPDLPGGIACRNFVDCGDDYAGTGQEALFLFSLADGNDFRYEAARLAGTDLVCLELCNDFGLCDRYTFPFRIVRENVNLPFFDDFSRDALRPDVNLWQNEDVLINRSYGINPPSIGVATFDAVDFRGRPYTASSNSPIPRDYLTSAGINMNTPGNATITFYAQPRGLGNRPEVQDSLVLQFRNENGTWQNAWSRAGLSNGEGNCSDRPFVGYRIPVPAQYNYNGFQFRFYNLSNQVGALDHWNLDYVKLDKQFTELNLADIAFIQQPPTVTAPYLAMPYRQFAAAGEALIRQDLAVGAWNHASPNPFLPANQSTYRILENTTAQQLLQPITFNVLDAIPAAEPFLSSENLSTLPGSLYADYRDALQGLPNSAGTEKYQVVTTYQLSSNTFNEVDALGIAPWVTANNTVTTTTRFDDYYAYDDGTAELALEALSGQTVVQEYRAYVPEVLKGISIRLPRVTTTGGGTIRLVVFLDSLRTNEPDFFLDVAPIYPENIYRDSLQGFTSYAFPEEIALPIGRFYVGWQQLGTCTNCVPVGLDRNNIIEGTRFFNNGGNWFPFEGCSTGAIMIRPLVGDSPVMETDVEDFKVANSARIAVFPNPASEVINLQRMDGGRLSDLRFQLYSLNGQLLRTGLNQDRIDLSDLAAGLYLLTTLDEVTGQVSRHKIVRQ